jgi:hypothetical protein
MNKEAIFWEWFKANNSKYFYLNQITDATKKEELLNLVLEKLHEYCDKLYFEIGGFPNEPQELIISAEGNRSYFNKVEELVSKAPKINDWQIIAHKPAIGTNFITEYEGIKLNPLEIWFLPLDNEKEPDVLGLRLCIPNYNSQQETKFVAGCYQMLDGLLGEKSVITNVHHVEVDKLPKKPETKGLIELRELPKYLIWRNTKA